MWYTISSYVLTSVLKYSCPVLNAKDCCWTVCNNKKYSRSKNTGLLHALTCGQWVGRSSLVLFVQGLFEENNYRMIIKNIDILFFRSRGLKTHLGERGFSSIQLDCIKQSRNKKKTLHKSSFEKILNSSYWGSGCLWKRCIFVCIFLAVFWNNILQNLNLAESWSLRERQPLHIEDLQ